MHESDFFIAGKPSEFLSRDHHHNVLVMTVLGCFSDSFQNLIVLFAGKPPIAPQEGIGKHSVLFSGLRQRLDVGKNGAILFFKTAFVASDLPEFEHLYLTHDAGDEAFVFVISLFHDSVSLSQLFSPL